MSNNRRPGFIDLNYGNNGVAAIPPQEPWNPDAYTLQVFPAASAPDGSMAFYGYNPDQSETPGAPGLFTRLNADGSWDSVTGHVGVSTEQTGPIPERLYAFTAMTHALVDGKESYITASRAIHVDDPENVYLHVAIGRYQAEDFKPAVEFGDDGIALPEPPRPTPANSKRTAIPKLLTTLEKQGRELKGVNYRNTPKLGVINGTIRAIFGGGYYTADTTEENTWCALLDAKTGKPVSGLGPQGQDSQYKLALIGAESITLYQSVFLADGGFLLLYEANKRLYLHRFLPNALPDKTFANGKGYIALSSVGLGAGMAVHNNTIVISQSGVMLPVGQPTELYCYTLAGEEDATFRRTLSVEGSTLVLDHLSFDSQGRLVLAGQRYYVAENNPYVQMEMQVVRLLSTGELDVTFGQDGYAPGEYYRAASNALYVDDQGIRVLTLMPPTLGPFYEYMVKLNS